MHTNAVSAVLATIAIGTVCVGCSTSSPQAVTSSSTSSPVPTINGPSATLSAVVDCGPDGAAQVRVAYGRFTKTKLVSRALAAHRPDAIFVFSENYGREDPAAPPSDFIITTTPTSGVCKTTLTNYMTGDVIAQRETAGFVMLRATLTG